MRAHDYILHSEMLSNEDNFLMHFGVKGMRWGVRRGHAAPTNVAPNRLVRRPEGQAAPTVGQRVRGAAGKVKATAAKVPQWMVAHPEASTMTMTGVGSVAAVTAKHLLNKKKRKAEANRFAMRRVSSAY